MHLRLRTADGRFTQDGVGALVSDLRSRSNRGCVSDHWAACPMLCSHVCSALRTVSSCCHCGIVLRDDWRGKLYRRAIYGTAEGVIRERGHPPPPAAPPSPGSRACLVTARPESCRRFVPRLRPESDSPQRVGRASPPGWPAPHSPASESPPNRRRPTSLTLIELPPADTALQSLGLMPQPAGASAQTLRCRDAPLCQFGVAAHD